MTYRTKARFEKTFQQRPFQERAQIVETVDRIRRFLETRQLPTGLGLKKLFSRGGLGAVFEARVTLALRILFAVQKDTVTFMLVGDHDEVRRFIRTFQ
jgi:hypothetical protein